MLASLGVGGVVSAGLTARLATRTSPWTMYTYAQSTGDERVLVAWYETYNGVVQEHQRGGTAANASATLDPATEPTYVPDVTGPVVDVTEILPGDSGRLAVGISLAERPDGSNPLSIDLTLDLQAASNAGQTEPERKAGPNPPDGTLAEEVSVHVWADSGLVPCDGVYAGGDTTIADGSLRSVSAELSSGYQLCESCFTPGIQYRCLGLAWALPEDAGNEVQTDTVTFELAAEVHDRLDEGTA